VWSLRPIYPAISSILYGNEEKTQEISNQLDCRECGALLKFAPGTSLLKCEYCGCENEIKVSDEPTVVEEINFETINSLTKLNEHQEFLLKLLTSKDSFIRKRIIEQNLSYLNHRLAHYLEKLTLPHEVKFRSDLEVDITQMGQEFDFDNLSRGERNRLILGLSWAFRDVYESLNRPINLLFIDELIDSGMDSNGVENALGILKKMSRDRNKSVWLVSHKDELSSRVNNILTVVKENGFTSYNTDVDAV
jgi:DNA repair exonuclease SbcCD ATPase subunit